MGRASQVLGFDLLKSGIFSVLPWVTMALFANLGGWLADTMVSRGVSVTLVRKVMQTVRALRPPTSALDSVPIIFSRACAHRQHRLQALFGERPATTCLAAMQRRRLGAA